MRLLTVGDSFTYGEELADRSLAWPHVLADKLKYTVINHGEPAVSNDHILRKVLEEIDNHDMIIIAWTHFARIEIADSCGIYDIWPGCSSSMFNDEMNYRKELIEYYTRHHDDEYLYNRYLDKILLMQHYLKSNNKKYIMLDAFGNNEVRSLSNTIENKIDIRYYLGWSDETMMEWTYGCPKGPGGHFLEQGHEIVADKIYEHIRHLGWIS
jgi:lysophospholipase L1-like esterase